MGKRLVLSAACLLVLSGAAKAQRLTLGGYGEATYSYNFYSDNPYRYLYPDRYKDTDGHGRFDLPHVVVMMGYDFGRGWTMGTEIEFEHGGTEVSIEVEGDEAIEVEHEVERGGEVFLEQFWLNKEFLPALQMRAGMLIVPVGLTNGHHLPTEFFTVFRPEGENTILPCTWHQIGISLWGRAGAWRYEGMLLPGLNSRFFDNAGWVHRGSASPYEYTVGNQLAGAFRVDNTSIRNLRLGLSAYAGGTNNDAYPRGQGISVVPDGTLLIGAFDFEYAGSHLVARGNADYGHLSNAAAIGTSNKNSDNSVYSPYSHTFVGRNALAFGAEAGVDLLSWRARPDGRRLFLFGRYEYYDSYVPSASQTDYQWTDRSRIALGVNYRPLKDIVIKAEYSHRFFKSQYNNEPSISLGIAYSGFFKH